jgi:hypothetical protein
VVAAALSLYLFHFYYKHIYIDMILTRQERERLVLDLCYNQGKNHTGDISRSWNVIRDIDAILKKAQEEKES